MHEVFNSLCICDKWLGILASSCHPETAFVLDKLADVTVRSSYPGRGLQWKLRCIWFSPEAEKLDKAVFFPLSFNRLCDLCNSFGLANREVSELNQLYSKHTVCLHFQLSDTQIQNHFTSSGIHIQNKHSQGQVFLLFLFHCKNRFPCLERSIGFIHASEQYIVS